MSAKSRLLIGASIILFLSLGGLFFAIQYWMPFMWFILVPALACLVAALYRDRAFYVNLLQMKTTKHGLNFGMLVVVSIIFLTALNFLAVKKNKTFDFSLASQYTLSAQTKNIISHLDKNIHLYFFYKEGAEGSELSKKAFGIMSKMYQDFSDKVKVEFIEMNSSPKMTEDFGATKGMGEAFVEYNGQKNRIESQFLGQQGQKFNEQEVSNAIIKVTRDKKKNIYIIEGHQERDFETEKNELGTYAFVQMLSKNSYSVKKMNFAQSSQVPQDADVVVILGPQGQFQKFEIESIKNYLSRGGSLFLTFDSKNNANMTDLLNRFGVRLQNKYIFNILNTQMGQVVNSGQPTVAVDYSSQSSITKVFSTNQTSVFVKPNAFELLSTPELVKVDVIVKTPKASVALLNIDSEKYEGQPASYNLGLEITGQLSKEAKPFKAVLFSDTDFLSNTVIFQNVNRDLALNAVSYLTGDADLISISPKEVNVTASKMSPPEFEQFFKFIVVGVLFPVPLILLAISVGLWLKQRHA